MPSVLDASAMLALAQGEPGAEIVEAALDWPGNTCYAHHANLCEVYYVTARRSGSDGARLVVDELVTTAGLVPFADPDMEFVWEVAELRARITAKRLAPSMADCCCIAAARAIGCELLTADRSDFQPVAALGLCQVTFIR
jgi:PIN domain nuclease of toxin-antitoxin system